MKKWNFTTLNIQPLPDNKDTVSANAWINFISNGQYFLTLHGDTQDIYRYDKDRGVYVNDGKEFIEQSCMYWMRESWTVHKTDSVLRGIRIRSHVARDVVDNDVRIINMKNGLLNLVTGELKPHTPDYLSITQMPYDYDPNAKAPRFEQFMDEILDDPVMREIVIKLMGYCLWRKFPREHIFIFLGEGRNGKGTLLNVIRLMLGEENCSSVAMHEISEKFMAAELFGKMANIAGDIGSDEIENDSLMKMITGKDFITAQRKHQHPFQFRSFAKPIFAGNKLPPVRDKTFAWYARQIIIPFNKRFVGDDQDPLLDEKLVKEIIGIFNIAYGGLKELMMNKWDFHYPMSIDQIEALYEEKSDSVTSFLINRCISDLENGEVPNTSKSFNRLKELHAPYLSYCGKNNFKNPLSQSKFKDALLMKGYTWIRHRFDVSQNPVWVIHGLRLMEEHSDNPLETFEQKDVLSPEERAKVTAELDATLRTLEEEDTRVAGEKYNIE